MEIIPLLLLVLICLALLFGYPVAFTLSGVSILFALICIPFGIFDESNMKKPEDHFCYLEWDIVIV